MVAVNNGEYWTARTQQRADNRNRLPALCLYIFMVFGGVRARGSQYFDTTQTLPRDYLHYPSHARAAPVPLVLSPRRVLAPLDAKIFLFLIFFSFLYKGGVGENFLFFARKMHLHCNCIKKTCNCINGTVNLENEDIWNTFAYASALQMHFKNMQLHGKKYAFALSG